MLDDVSKTSDEALRHRAMTALGTLALWCLKDVRKPGHLFRNLGIFADLLNDVWRAPNGGAAIYAILRYIVTTGEGQTHTRENDLPKKLRHLLAPVDEAKMETLLDQLQELYMERGIERGVALGRREMLLRQLRKRFGELSDGAVSRVNGADVPTLDVWADRVLTASTLDEVWASPTK